MVTKKERRLTGLVGGTDGRTTGGSIGGRRVSDRPQAAAAAAAV